MNFAPFFAGYRNLEVDDVQETAQGLRVTARVVSPRARCPRCQQTTRRVHSRYARCLGDMPWQGRTVQLRLAVRRFVCVQSHCPQRIFCERLAPMAGRYARRTQGLTTALTELGNALGGESGARVAQHLGMSSSPDTLLRLVRHAPGPPTSTPRVVGLDDWAQRKGQRYGTLLVDLERHCPLELLPDREATTVAQWLCAHPSVKTISRDRAGVYADGIRQGAPHARQVADRWHLLRNVIEAGERFLQRQHRALRQAAQIVTTQRRAQAGTPSPLPPPTLGAQATIARDRRIARYAEIRSLYRQGMSLRAIARRLGIHRHTVRQFAYAESFPERARPCPRRSCLDPFLPDLHQRWEAGCHNAAALWRDLRHQGFRGTADLVRLHRRRWHGLRPGAGGRLRATLGPPAPLPFPPPSARTTIWWLLRELKKKAKPLTTKQQAFLTQLGQLCPSVRQLQTLILAFAQLLRKRQGKALAAWLVAARTSSIPELGHFATGLQRDRRAVQAACTSRWSNGQVEGQINRLKLLKRQMFGRAKLDLLKARFLYAA